MVDLGPTRASVAARWLSLGRWSGYMWTCGVASTQRISEWNAPWSPAGRLAALSPFVLSPYAHQKPILSALSFSEDQQDQDKTHRRFHSSISHPFPKPIYFACGFYDLTFTPLLLRFVHPSLHHKTLPALHFSTLAHPHLYEATQPQQLTVFPLESRRSSITPTVRLHQLMNPLLLDLASR